MRILVFACAMMSMVVCDSAMAASRTPPKREALCIAVFEVASSLYEKDGTVPRTLSKRMHGARECGYYACPHRR